jgi:Fe-S cluster assembly protein SufD
MQLAGTVSEKVERGMTVQMLTTKAEQAILKSFEDNAADLPGGTAVVELRRAAIGAFASMGFPSRRVEEFKYTDLKANIKDVLPLAVGNAPGSASAGTLSEHFAALAENAVSFVDGRGVAEKNEIKFLAGILTNPPNWIEVALADPALAASADLLLNTALFTDGAVIDIAAGAEPEAPIVIASSTQDNALTALRHVIRVGKGAKLTIVEIEQAPRTAGVRQSSALTQIEVAEGAEVAHIKVVEARKGSLHLSHAQVSLGANATYNPFQMTVGDGLVRNGLNVLFNGQHTTFDFAAASIVHGTGHADSTLVIDHKVPHCTSRELFKCVLHGQARAVFQGKVIVRPDAQKSDGKQMAQALMLSPDTEFDSKPELEIYADDVVCGHGSTAAEIDSDLIFYCTSRGIPAPVARAMLIESFIGEAIAKVAHDGLREALTVLARDSLTAA